MEFGLFLEFPRPIDGDHHDAFVQSFRLVQEAEDLGVKSVWLAEYHFNMERVLASPVTIATAIAAKTSTMRIGTAVYCLPLGHPIRVAEGNGGAGPHQRWPAGDGHRSRNLPQRARRVQRLI